jgi:hypothetical protein
MITIFPMPELGRSKKLGVFTVVLVVEVLVFTIGIAPLHVSAPAAHTNCHVCSLIESPPVLNATVSLAGAPADPSGLLPLLEGLPDICEPASLSRPSRAPPSLI